MMKRADNEIRLSTLLIILLALTIVGTLLMHLQAKEKIMISWNESSLSAQEIIKKNGGFSQAPTLKKKYNFFAIIRADGFSPEDYKKIIPEAKIWTEGRHPDRRHYVFQNDPILEDNLKTCM